MDQQQQKPPRRPKPDWGLPVATFSGVVAYSNHNLNKQFEDINNWRAEIKKFQAFTKLQKNGNSDDLIEIYTGFKYQCVEYARRFMVLTQQAKFQDIDCAFQIFDLQSVTDVFDESIQLPFHSFKNGENEPPKPGDLIISQKSENQKVGHVSVVVRVNLEEQYVDIIEQNYDHRSYEDSTDHTRRLVFDTKNGRFYLYNKRVGRVYPKVKHYSDSEDSDEEGILGWKRVDREIKPFNN